MGPHPYPWMVREFHRVHRRRGRGPSAEQLPRRRDCPTSWSPASAADPTPSASSPASPSTADVELVGVEPAGGAAVGHGVPGIVHGMQSYLMQDEFGQVLEAESISAGLDYPGVGPEHAHLADDRPGPVRAGHRRRGDRRVPAARPAPRASSPRWSRPTPSPGCRGSAATLAGQTVVINLSGRGDKDVAQMMDILADEL